MRLEDVSIILCRPSEAGNVGAVCRAMKNMGLFSLRVILGEKNLDLEEIRKRAVHAEDVWDSVQLFSDLESAVSDCSLVVGTTRRRGQKRKEYSISPDMLAERLGNSGGRAALVFGNERTGLTEDELNSCNMAAHIPANPEFPSLNLSHAVQIFAWELYKHLDGHRSVSRGGISQETLSELTADICSSLASLGFYKIKSDEQQRRFFTEIFARASLSKHESDYLSRIFKKIEALSSKNLKP